MFTYLRSEQIPSFDGRNSIFPIFVNNCYIFFMVILGNVSCDKKLDLFGSAVLIYRLSLKKVRFESTKYRSNVLKRASSRYNTHKCEGSSIKLFSLKCRTDSNRGSSETAIKNRSRPFGRETP